LVIQSKTEKLFGKNMISTNSLVKVVEHPLVQETLTRIRDYTTPASEFRALAIKLGKFLVYEAMTDLTKRAAGVETPIGPAQGVVLSDYVILAPILRAGLLLAEGAQELFPAARIYHIGLRRDENTFEAHSYYARLPEALPLESRVFVLDPMLATGGSVGTAIALFDKLGVEQIHLVSFVAAPEGIKSVHSKFPKVKITTAAIDHALNEHAYIVPGLGDAGDRAFGT
jgi:uracil phosphoribosyltransferase